VTGPLSVGRVGPTKGGIPRRRKVKGGGGGGGGMNSSHLNNRPVRTIHIRGKFSLGTKEGCWGEVEKGKHIRGNPLRRKGERMQRPKEAVGTMQSPEDAT